MVKSSFPTRLLIVDADDQARTFLRRRFTRLGHEVVEAAEHAKALALIATVPFDLVLLDLETAGPDGACGLDLLRHMRLSRSAAELPVLAIAPEMAGEDVVEALALGADDCLMRPLYAGVALARAEMLIARQLEPAAPEAARRRLETRLETLEEAAVRSEAVAANLVALGHDARAPLNGLVGAAAALTAICKTPELKRAVATIEAAADALDRVIVEALGHADRRTRAAKTQVRVLLADHDAGSRLAIHQLLDAAEVEVQLVEVAGGLAAALATDAQFFDLILVSLAAPEAIAGVRAIRRSERQNLTRRTPILTFEGRGQGAVEAMRAGADLYLRWPLTGERVLGALAEALTRESEDVCAVA